MEEIQPTVSSSAGDPEPMRHAIVLAPDGVIDIAIHGVWTVAQVERFFAQLAPEHERARRQRGRVRMLVRVGSVQAPSVAMHVRDRALSIMRPGDRNAAVVATFLSKLQIKRVGVGGDFAIFTDPVAARAWLLEP